MRRRPLLSTALALLSLLAACGGGGMAAPPPAPVPPPTVTPGSWVVMGSSTAYGTGAPVGQGWAALLAAAGSSRQVTLHNIARGGALTSQALPADAPRAGRAAPDPAINIDRALALAPKLLILSFPTNDAAAAIPAAETVDNLRVVATRAAAAGASVLVVSTQPRDGLNAAGQAALAEFDRVAAGVWGPCFVAVNALLSDGSGRIATAYAYGDGVHLNAAGHQRLFDALWAALDGGRCVRLAPP